MQNPFVYGEVVPGESFVDREAELDRLIGDLSAGQKVFLHLSPPVRQVLAHPPGAECAVPARRPDARGHGQQLQLLPVLSRRIRARARGGRDTMGARPRLAHQGDRVDASRGPLRRRRHRPGALLGRLSAGQERTRREPSRERGLHAAGPPGGRAEALDGRRPRRVSGDRRASTAAASSTR